MGDEALAAACRPYWEAEALLIRAYFDGPRTRATDRAWILRQAHKEYWDGFAAHLTRLRPGDGDVLSTLETARSVVEELEHYLDFASLYDALCDGPPLTPQAAREAGWPANDRLMAVRAKHRADYGGLGTRASLYTEGGHMALYSEGMRLAGRGGFDDAIAEACGRVYADEAHHMALGVRDLVLSEPEWDLLGALVLEQLELRLRMRWEQFGRHLPETALQSILGSSSL